MTRRRRRPARARSASPLTITGDARSRRIVNSLSVNYSPWRRRGLRRTKSRCSGARATSSERLRRRRHRRLEQRRRRRLPLRSQPTRSTSASPAPSATGVGGSSVAWSGGPSIGITPFDNGWLSVGWNVVGFHDRDFEEARYTRSGPYVTMRFKFDQLSLERAGPGAAMMRDPVSLPALLAALLLAAPAAAACDANNTYRYSPSSSVGQRVAQLCQHLHLHRDEPTGGATRNFTSPSRTNGLSSIQVNSDNMPQISTT